MASIDHLRSGQPLNTTKTTQSKSQSTTVETTSTTNKLVAENKLDEFSLSDQSKAINAMNHKMAAETHFDGTKVAAIKAAIANGSYHIDPEKLAENMLKHEAELKGIN